MAKLETKKRRLPSVKLNMVLSALKSVLQVAFPLISFPYVSRVLQVERMGVINYCVALMSYFLLIAQFGIGDYAVRDGAKVRDDPEGFQGFADEVFGINLVTTIVAYALFGLYMVVVRPAFPYNILLAIQSINLIFTMLGREWIYRVYEDYAYITTRSIVFQIISLVLMFALVKNENDYILYAAIGVFASSGSNILNFIRSRRYCKVGVRVTKESIKRLRVMAVFFLSTLSVTLYTNFDITMLESWHGDYEVGIYSTAVKVYTILVSLMVAVVTVTMPRISNLVSDFEKRADLKNLLRWTHDVTLTIVMPLAVGTIMLSDDIILVLAGETYQASTVPLRILSIALVVAIMATYWGECVLLPFDKEKVILANVCICAAINLVLNAALIPSLGYVAAAFTTFASQAVSMAISLIYAKKNLIDLSIGVGIILKVLAGCAGVVGVCIACSSIGSLIARAALSVALSIVTFFLIELAVSNGVIVSGARNMRAKFSSRIKDARGR